MNLINKKLSNLILILTLLLSSSCAMGIFTLHKSEKEYNKIFSYEIEKNGSIYWKSDVKYSKEEVIEKLGKPDKSWQKSKKSYLLYYTNNWLRFSGIVPTFFIIPIPLVVPVGTKHHILVFDEQGFFIKMIVVGTQSHITGCGMGAQKMEWECYWWKGDGNAMN
jgi:hypothetical protein